MEGSDPQIAALLVAGLWALARGMVGYRTAIRIGDTGTSRIATLTAGEVRYRYNTRISTIPTLPLAWVFGWKPRDFFAAAPQESARPDATL